MRFFKRAFISFLRFRERNPRLVDISVVGVSAVLLATLVILLIPSPKEDKVVSVVSAVSTADPAQSTDSGEEVLSAADEAPAGDEMPSDAETPADVEDAGIESTVGDEAAAPVQTTGELMPTEFQVLDTLTTDRPLGLQECDVVDHSYFNETVFIGDSISQKLNVYVSKMRKKYPEFLGNSIFLTAQSLSSRNALKDVTETSLHPSFRGKKMKLEDAVAASGAKQVYVMLGMNDVGVSGVNQSVKNLMTLLRAIKDKSPDIKIFVQSATPRMSGSRPTTKQLFEYNLKVYQYCLHYQDQGLYFVDVGYAMRDAEGKLIEDYCSDPSGMAIHFTDAGCKRWVQYLYTHALV